MSKDVQVACLCSTSHTSIINNYMKNMNKTNGKVQIAERAM